MAKTLKEFTGVGDRTSYPVSFGLGFISREHVFVYSGELTEYSTQLSYTWSNSNTIELDEPLPVGQVMYIRRVVPRSELINDYEDGAILRESNLDASFLQALMILEEIQDGFFIPNGFGDVTFDENNEYNIMLNGYTYTKSEIDQFLNDLEIGSNVNAGNVKFTGTTDYAANNVEDALEAEAVLRQANSARLSSVEGNVSTNNVSIGIINSDLEVIMNRLLVVENRSLSNTIDISSLSNSKANRVVDGTAGNIAIIADDGDFADSGKTPEDIVNETRNEVESTEALSTSTLDGLVEGDIVYSKCYATLGDGGNARWQLSGDVGLTPTQVPRDRDDGGVVDALGRLWNKVGKAAFLAQFGVFKNSGNDETAGIRSAINYHAINGVTLYIESGEYIFSGISRTSKDKINIVGLNGRATFKSTAVNQRTFRFQCNNSEVTFDASENITVGQDNITLNDVTGLQVGMMIRITSNVLWPYDARSVYYGGETHVVQRIEGNTVYFTDRTRSTYTLAQIDNITAWMPTELKLENLEVDHSDFRGTACYQITGYYEPIFRNLKSVKAKTAGLWMLRCWHPRAYDIHSEYIGDGIETGYGAQDRSCVGLRIDGLYTVGCRRSFDAETESGSNGSPSRDYLVTNFIVRGGGDYFPETTETSYGIGNHGPSENGRFTNGKIYDCKVGINHRGLKLEISNIDIFGRCVTPVDGSFGSGYNINNVRYYPSEFPLTSGDLAGLTPEFLPECFIRFGRKSTNDADFNFDLPIEISNCTAIGIRDSFIFSENNSQKLSRLNVNNNIITPNQDVSLGTFYTVRHLSSFARSTFSNNLIDAGERVSEFCNNDVGVRDGVDDNYAVIVDTSWNFRIDDDDFISIPRVVHYVGARPIIGLSTDAGGREIFELRPDNAARVRQSVSNWAGLTTTDAAASLNGTFGVDGDYTIGLTSSNTVYLENRAGSSRSFRMSLVT